MCNIEMCNEWKKETIFFTRLINFAIHSQLVYSKHPRGLFSHPAKAPNLRAQLNVWWTIIARIIYTEQAVNNDNDDTITRKLNGMRIPIPSAGAGMFLLIDYWCNHYLVEHSIWLKENIRKH